MWKEAALFAIAGLAPVSLVSAQDPNDCWMVCDNEFEAAVADCARADGVLDPECMHRAELARLECELGCDPLDGPDRCLERCDVAFKRAMLDCDSRECYEEAERVHAACLEACGWEPPPPPPPDPCVSECEAEFQRAMEACATSAGVLDRECVRRAELARLECELGCAPDDDPALCLERCDIALKQAMLDCDSPECYEEAERVHQACHESCGWEPPPPPPPPDPCISECQQAYEAAMELCRAAEDPALGMLDPECMHRAELARLECELGCDPDNDPSRCVEGCDIAFRLAMLDCDSEDCVAEAERARDACYESCGWEPPPPPPPPDPCTSECEQEFRRAMEACTTADDAANGILDPECMERAELALLECQLQCAPEDDPDRCRRACDLQLEQALLECDGPECVEEAQTAYAGCMETCGIDVPDIPEPDPCTSECDARYEREISECMQQGDANTLGEECFARVERRYLGCLLECGVELPEPPPVPDDRCVVGCDAAYRESMLSCMDEATGEVDAACMVAVDQAYLDCLEDCGMDIPEDPDLPGPPLDQCSLSCDEGLLTALWECFDSNRTLDVQCVLDIVAEFQACRESCEGEAEQRVIAAVIHSAGQGGAFIRGDANQDQVVDLSDPTFILDELYKGGASSSCRDASDANDDGTVDLSDPIVILSRLFLGGNPLPAPTESPGYDPTRDNLDCNID